MTVLDSGFQVLDSGLKPLADSQSPGSELRFPKSWILDSTRNNSRIPESGIPFILALKELFSATYKTVNTNVTLFQLAR